MNGIKVGWLQWTYPMVLWMIVAFFTMLACKNVVGSNWKPAQPAAVLSHTFTAVPDAIGGGDSSEIDFEGSFSDTEEMGDRFPGQTLAQVAH